MAVILGKGLAPMDLVFLRLTAKTLQYLSLAPVAPAKLQGLAADEIVIDLVATLKVYYFTH